MELKKIIGQVRNDVGKEAANRTRKAGRVPAVVYGTALEAPLPVSLDPREMVPMVERVNKGRQFELVLGERSIPVFIRDFQVHPVRRSLLHMDLQATQADVPIRAKVPVSLQGPALGEKLGGRVFKVAYDILLEALPDRFPVSVDIDIRQMDTGDVVYVDQIAFGEGVRAVYQQRYPVVLVRTPRGTSAEGEAKPAGEGEAAEGEGAEKEEAETSKE